MRGFLDTLQNRGTFRDQMLGWRFGKTSSRLGVWTDGILNLMMFRNWKI